MRRRLRKTLLKNAVYAAGGGTLLIAAIVLVWLMTIDIPSVDGFHNRRVAESTKIYDSTGTVLLYDVHGTVRRTAVPLSEISRNVRNATIAIEDAEFYEHAGVKPTAIARAVLVNLGLREGYRGQGGSTITQQVVKNTLLSSEKTITRKVKEWILALRIEHLITKDDILTIYLNETPYGGTIYGAEEASRYFFGKSAKDLSLTESAYLAALPQAPTYYSPYGNHRDALEERKNLVLLKMKENGFITDEEYRQSLNERVVFNQNDENGIRAPHFVFFVREYLETTYGVDRVNEGGLQVVTTLNWELQQKAEELVAKYANINTRTFNAENAALVAIDPTTGHILSMVGSRGYFDEKVDGKYNVAVAERQPGSAFKPFVYATAFAKGYTPDTVVFDLPTQFNANCEPTDLVTHDNCYAPGNYDDTFRGPMTLRDALAQSVNIPAVKTLYLAGVKESIETAQRLGITTLTRPLGYYGLPLVLGGGEVTLLDMVSAYSVLGNDGVRNPPVSIVRVTDRDGEVLEEYEAAPVNALDAEVARTISDVLSDNTARTPAFGERSALYIAEQPVAVKTGTTNDYRDVWIVGYTPTIAVGAWAGNNDNRPMEKKVAGFIIAPLWNEFMRFALTKVPREDFVKPSAVEKVGAPILYGEWNSREGAHSILYWVDKENPLGGKPKNPEQDPQFRLWEYPVLLWSNGVVATTSPQPKQSSGESYVAPVVRTLRITSPTPGQEIGVGHLITVTVENPYGDDMRKVSYYVNGIFIGATDRAPFSISFVPTAPGKTTVTAVAEGRLEQIGAQVSFFVR